MYGFIDESGTPGVAINSRDCFLVSIVLFDSENARDKCSDSIDRLRARLKLPDDYEFHCSKNSERPRAEFIKLMSSLDFRFITIAIHKNDFKKTTAYSRIADMLISEIIKHSNEVKIDMDANPILYSELKKAVKKRDLHYLKFKECDSKKNNLLQLVDYVVSISAKKVKNTPKASQWYSKIAKKVLTFIEIAD